MSRFLEVIPGVCISTRRILSIELQEQKELTGMIYRILVFTDIPGDQNVPITYVYDHRLFNDRESAMAALREVVAQCEGVVDWGAAWNRREEVEDND